jgi:hypothetical protein
MSEDEIKITIGRSPAYPSIALPKAIDRLNEAYLKGIRDQAYPPETYYKIWGLGSQSSGSRQVMAALNHYGLVEYEGRGEGRKVRLTAVALDILRDRRPDSHERLALIRSVALKPLIFEKLYDRFASNDASEVLVEHFLVAESGYNEGAVDGLWKAYSETIDFAKLGLSESYHLNGENAGEDGSEEANRTNLNRGMSEARSAMIPTIYTPQQSAALESASPIQSVVQETVLGRREDKASLDEGEVVLFWPETLSAESVDDLEYWLSGIIRRARRRAGQSRNEEE